MLNNWSNDESFACYFQKEIEFSEDKLHPSNERMFNINLTIKESDRVFANFDPIAEELYMHYKQSVKNPD